jgi:hypothetical protein
MIASHSGHTSLPTQTLGLNPTQDMDVCVQVVALQQAEMPTKESTVYRLRN